MSFNIDKVFKDMTSTVKDIVKEELGDIKQYGKEILEAEKKELESLAIERLEGKINDEEFNIEVEREKKVLEVQLQTIKIMSKALAQEAINEAIEVFIKAVKAAI